MSEDALLYDIHLPVHAETFDDRHDLAGLRIYDASNREVAWATNPYAHLETERPDVWRVGAQMAEAFARQIVRTMNTSDELYRTLALIRDEVHGLELTHLHIQMLQRGAGGEWIGLSDDMGRRVGEVAALGDLERAGLVRDADGPFPPGPPELPPKVITEAGQAALRKAERDRWKAKAKLRSLDEISHSLALRNGAPQS